MKAPKISAAPDPNVVAAAQTGSNVNTGISNSYLGNANERGPLGNVTYKATGNNLVDGRNVPTFTKTTTLSPTQRNLYNQQTAIGAQENDIAGQELGQLKNSLSTPLNYNGLPQAPTYDRQHYEDALNSRLEPQLQRDRSALENQLANQGVRSGSEAYREAIALSDRGRNDSRSQTVLNAGNYADQEQAAGYQARNHAIQERTNLRSQPINEISTLMNGGQVTMPQFAQYRCGNVAGTDTAGIQQQGFQNQMGIYNQQLQNRNAMFGGIAGLAGSVLGGPIGGAIGKSMFGGIGGGGGKQPIY